MFVIHNETRLGSMFFCRRYDHEWTVSNFIGAGVGVVIVVVSSKVGHIRWLRLDSRVVANRGEETCIKRKGSID